MGYFVLRKILITLVAVAFLGIPLTAGGCDKTAENTNKPVVIHGFQFTVAGDPVTPSGTIQISPGVVLNIEVSYTDPDSGEDPDPSWFSFTWVVERIGTGVSTFNPNEFFIAYQENPCIWTAPEVTGFYRFLVEVRDRYGTPSQETIVVEVNSNKQPIITELQVSNNQPFVNEEIVITAVATDPDANLPLEYLWQADGGYFTLENEGEAHWLSPVSGSFQITLVVTDQKNGTVSRNIPVVVQTNHDPVIQGWDLDPGNNVGFGELVTITLSASDEDGDTLEYNWSADFGTFNTVNESIAIWRSPLEAVAAKITCSVEDNSGGIDTVEIIINVAEQ